MEYSVQQQPRSVFAAASTQPELDDRDSDYSDSECESGVTSGSDVRHVSTEGLERLAEGERVHDLIRKRFVASLGLLGPHVTVSAVYKNPHSGLTGQARLRTFQVYMKAVEEKCGGGDANVKYAWYSPSSKAEISSIIGHGFSENLNGSYGKGVYLAPDDSPLECLDSLSVDEDGLRHLLLCRVILGRAEVVLPGNAEQYHPSSQEFDSGVERMVCPKKYIVWSTHMNTHILPEYLISFRAPSCLKEFLKTQVGIRRPTSPWMPLPTLISVLSKFLPQQSIALILKYHKAHRETKVSRNELIQKIRQIAGDKLLATILKSFRAKQIKPLQGVAQGSGSDRMECRTNFGDGPILFGVNLKQL